jgi:hypothetical protein
MYTHIGKRKIDLEVTTTYLGSEKPNRLRILR